MLIPNESDNLDATLASWLKVTSELRPRRFQDSQDPREFQDRTSAPCWARDFSFDVETSNKISLPRHKHNTARGSGRNGTRIGSIMQRWSFTLKVTWADSDTIRIHRYNKDERPPLFMQIIDEL
ncbi:hypothetical protein HN011_004458 [Eciton burchellii]|nr:hypothetical protein HN011_004458 [Eciton burchellii]